MIYKTIEALVGYALDKGLIDKNETIYSRNRLLDVMREDSFVPSQPAEKKDLPALLKTLTDCAVEKGLCSDTTESRDIFDTRLMNCVTPRPREVIREFSERYSRSPKEATDWFYRFSGDVNYIRRDRIARDRRWKISSEYGEIDITINLSKPEKDPRDIAAAGKAKTAAYPLCQLCAENVGYAGRIGHPARANHRTIPMKINGENWFLQYSPYVYYNEHCIAFNSSHVPMKINRAAFDKLLDFVRQFPHYFIGSNADLPIVGGSILSHDHFQGGGYTFAMANAEVERRFTVNGFEDVECGIVKWPLSVIRLKSADSEALARLAEHILKKWRGYTDEAAMIFAYTDDVPHNTITPIARRRGDDYELDLCLRNNITTDEHPLGLFHPHAQYHHIKKENIGLIEVMGLAVLPARLQKELDLLEQFIADGRDISSDESIAKHAEWAQGFAAELEAQPRETIRKTLEQEVGKVFLGVLEDAGVFKRDENGKQAFGRFVESI